MTRVVVLGLDDENSRRTGRMSVHVARLKITLVGELAGMLTAAGDSKRSPDTGDPLLQIQSVAGSCGGTQPTGFGASVGRG